MKILLISALPPPEGGIAIWTQKYMAYCKEKGQEVQIVNIALQGQRAERINRERNYLDEVKRTLSVLRSLHRGLREFKPDIVHLNTACARFGVFRDLLCARKVSKAGVPLIVHCRCNVQDQLNGKKIAVWAFAKMIKYSQKVLTLNKKSFEYVECIGHDKAITIANFVDQSTVNNESVTREEFKKAVFVGHVQQSKGAVEIIEAAKKLPNIQFDLIGPVHEAIQVKKCTGNIRFVGAVPPQNVKEYYNAADVFVFPTYTEGFSNALAEAMAAGLPVITTDVGANSEMIEDKGGVIVPVGDSEALVQALVKLQNQDVRKRMSQWNINKVKNCYLIDAVMEKLFSIYCTVLNA